MSQTYPNMFITYIPATDIGKEHIHDLYTLRWQIEILFKTS
ncbi:hypothetical protein Len3610_18810 [Lentibacillus sp. CBA3610]|nr:hypothetical protein Len3610_18810 [Lentibacillus sp. CBA3610]